MPAIEADRALNTQAPTVVKCPTPQCPGWITLDNTRHQTEPCRYCRVGVDTLRFLLSRVGAEHKALPPQVHDTFNRLMLNMAGSWGRNVYLRPSRKTLVDLQVGARGVTIEYNPLLGAAGLDGAAPLVGTILHKLLHFEAHLGQRVPEIAVKTGAREKASLAPLMTYILTVADHAWVGERLRRLYPGLHDATSRWGLDLVTMLVGSESMFNRYLSDRNLQKLLPVLQHAGDSAEAFRDSVVARLAELTAGTLSREKEDPRRVYMAVQLANVRLLSPAAYQPYLDAITATGVENLREAVPLAERVFTELSALQAAGDSPNIEPSQFHGALQGAVKALGMANFFEVK